MQNRPDLPRSEPGPEPLAPLLRDVHRAIAELRRGTPILVRGPENLVVLAAETAGASGLAAMAALSAGPALLLLAPVRAAALLRRPMQPSGPAVALRTAGLFDPSVLRGLADPTAEQILPDLPEIAPAPDGADAALAAVKLARLLPAALVALAPPRAAALAQQMDVLSVAAEDILSYPAQAAAGLARVAEAQVPLQDAPDARIVAFRAPDAGVEHLAILVGRPEDAAPGSAPLTRVHSECFTGDLLASLRCDCGAQLRTALRRMGDEGTGIVLYLAQEGRGIGLVNKLRAYALQDRGLDTVDANRALGWAADERNFLIAATMLQLLGVRRIRLLTNNPDKMTALAACGIEIAGRESLIVAPNGVNDHYLATKARRFGHLLGSEPDGAP